MQQGIEERADFGSIRYASCWEDPDILAEALRPAPKQCLLSIASGGDNALALLATGAAVVAVDLSAAQLACVELKKEAIRSLDYPDLLAFVGVTPSDDRTDTYATLRHNLSETARRFWDTAPAAIAGGIIHAGKFERYFHLFRRRVLPLVHSRGTVDTLLRPKDQTQRQIFYQTRWNTWRWQLMFRVFFSRFVMGRLGRDPEFFRYVKGAVAERILERARYALTVLPTHNNPFLRYILKGNFSAGALPAYLQEENIETIRNGLDGLTLIQGTVQDAEPPPGTNGFDGYNLSDIFEYLTPEVGRQIYKMLLDKANPGARFAYWNMLAERRFAQHFPKRVIACNSEAKPLFARDRAFFYRAFVVEEARP